MNLNWNWSWGSLSGLILGSQIVTGILLAMHYVGHVDHAFASVQHLMVDVPSGMILRYAHANGASLFFTVVYLHVLRGLYYSSGNQPREIVWISGVVILLLMIITAFIGYVLPWGMLNGPKCILTEMIFLKCDGLATLESCLLAVEDCFSLLKPIYKSLSIEVDTKNESLIYMCLISNSKELLTSSRLDSNCSYIVKNLHQNKQLLIKGVMTNIDPKVISVSVGSLIADAHCEKRGVSARLTIKQSNVHADWFFWLYHIFATNQLCSPVKPTLKTTVLKSNNKSYYYYKFNTYAHPLFLILHNLFYDSNKIKVLDVLIIPFLDALAIAVWIADDGYNHNGSTAFCTDSFKKESLDILITAFKDNHGITLVPFTHVTYTRLRVVREDMPKFAALVKPYLHLSMFYKLGDFKDN